MWCLSCYQLYIIKHKLYGVLLALSIGNGLKTKQTDLFQFYLYQILAPLLHRCDAKFQYSMYVLLIWYMHCATGWDGSKSTSDYRILLPCRRVRTANIPLCHISWPECGDFRGKSEQVGWCIFCCFYTQQSFCFMKYTYYEGHDFHQITCESDKIKYISCYSFICAYNLSSTLTIRDMTVCNLEVLCCLLIHLSAPVCLNICSQIFITSLCKADHVTLKIQENKLHSSSLHRTL